MSSNVNTEITTLAAELKAADIKAGADAKKQRENPAWYQVSATVKTVIAEAQAEIGRNNEVKVAKLEYDAAGKHLKAVTLKNCPTEVRVIRDAKDAKKVYAKSILMADPSKPAPDFASFQAEWDAIKAGKKKAVAEIKATA